MYSFFNFFVVALNDVTCINYAFICRDFLFVCFCFVFVSGGGGGGGGSDNAC